MCFSESEVQTEPDASSSALRIVARAIIAASQTPPNTRARVSRFLVRQDLDIRLQRVELGVQLGPVLLESHDDRVELGA